MLDLLIVKRPGEAFGADSRKLLGDRVVGVALGNEPVVFEHAYTPTGQEVEERIDLNYQTADLAVGFYEQTLAMPPEQAPVYYCHTFTWYVLGALAVPKHHKRYIDNGQAPARADALAAGKGYAIQTASGGINHSMLGIDGTNRSLSVLGGMNAMALCKSDELLAYYGGVDVVSIKPHSVR